MIGYYIVKAFSWLLCHAPVWVRRGVAAFLGKVSLLAMPGWRMQMAIANVEECLGVSHAEAERIAKASLTRFGRMVVEVMRFPLLNKANIHQLVKVKGLEHLEAAYAEEKGVILATGHFGNWELLGATVALHGYPLLSIARKQNNGAMDKLINELRELSGQKITYNRGGNAMRMIAKIIKEKNCLGVLYDQDTNDDGVILDIFGKSSVVPSGAAALSRLHGAPVLPIFLHNLEDGTCEAVIYPPVHTEKTADRKADYEHTMQQLITVLENEIRAYPEMWFWAHDRWKDGRERFHSKK